MNSSTNSNSKTSSNTNSQGSNNSNSNSNSNSNKNDNDNDNFEKMYCQQQTYHFNYHNYHQDQEQLQLRQQLQQQQQQQLLKSSATASISIHECDCNCPIVNVNDDANVNANANSSVSLLYSSTILIIGIIIGVVIMIIYSAYTAYASKESKTSTSKSKSSKTLSSASIMWLSFISSYVKKTKNWIYWNMNIFQEEQSQKKENQQYQQQQKQQQGKQCEYQQTKIKQNIKKSECRVDDLLSFNKKPNNSQRQPQTQKQSQSDNNRNGSHNNENEKEYEVLKGSIMVFMKQFFNDDIATSTIATDAKYNDAAAAAMADANTTQKNHFTSLSSSSLSSSPPSSKVVNYMSPKEMALQLFDKSKSTSMSLFHHHNDSMSRRCSTTSSTSLSSSTSSSSTSSSSPSSTYTSPQIMIQLFEQIQNYSVNTSHPYFFNQLFGALDPIALAGEIISLAAHTSSYTWETAPVFTMMEREVMCRLGQLVFERDDNNNNDDNDNDDQSSISNDESNNSNDACNNENNDNQNDAYDDMVNNKYDGLMLPGGSLSNLTAIHVARHYCLYGTNAKTKRNDENDSGNSETYSNTTATTATATTTINSSISSSSLSSSLSSSSDMGEEKKEQCYDNNGSSSPLTSLASLAPTSQLEKTKLVAFVSSEAHYSFIKSASVTGIGIENLVSVPTLPNGQMDVNKLDILLSDFHDSYSTVCDNENERIHRMPFFVAATAGSTVRGSFDNIDAIVQVCRKHQNLINRKMNDTHSTMKRRKCKIWVHVDGAWGGSAIFSQRGDMKHIMKGIQHVDSFTFNPHKLLGAPQQTTAFISRQKGILKAANSSGAKYLFDSRKNGAECDLGDASYTCGRRTDSVKLWAMWKYYGSDGIGKMLERKADSLSLFAKMVQAHDSFMLACTPWPFNVNFFYLPDRIRNKLRESGVDMSSENPILPDEISKELAIVSVKLKLKLHQSGEMLIPYQPLSNQKADCFRLVLAGNKLFEKLDYENVLQLMVKFGSDL